MKYRFVTSMSREGYDTYGRTFLDTYSKHVHFPLTVYSEDNLLPERPFIDLNQDDELATFLEDCPPSKDYRFDAGKFAKKVFAITASRSRYEDWRIWLDADVVIEKPITEDFLKRVCPDDMMGSYLGRKDWHHSECGWVAYNMAYAYGFLYAFRQMYVSGEIFDHMEWHDSYLFDRLRERTAGDWLNLSEGVFGMHVWDGSPLGEVMKHLKGPLRKAGKIADVPENYWSENERAP